MRFPHPAALSESHAHFRMCCSELDTYLRALHHTFFGAYHHRRLPRTVWIHLLRWFSTVRAGLAPHKLCGAPPPTLTTVLPPTPHLPLQRTPHQQPGITAPRRVKRWRVWCGVSHASGALVRLLTFLRRCGMPLCLLVMDKTALSHAAHAFRRTAGSPPSAYCRMAA